jgi:hypothetical protein
MAELDLGSPLLTSQRDWMADARYGCGDGQGGRGAGIRNLGGLREAAPESQ